jgi:hypothetical protein
LIKATESRDTSLPRNGSAAPEPVEAVENKVERQLEFDVVIAWSEGATVGDREGHLHDVRMGGTQLVREARGRLRIEVRSPESSKRSCVNPSARLPRMCRA